MAGYLKDNPVKDGRDVNSTMCEMMSVIFEGALDGELGYSSMTTKTGIIYKLWNENWAILSTYDSLLKMLYLAAMDITRKWNGHRQDWGKIRAQLMIYFQDGLNAIQ